MCKREGDVFLGRGTG